MSKKNTTKRERRIRRRARVRSRVQGTATVPRLNVFRGLRSLSLQLIDDTAGNTIVSVNSKKDVPEKGDAGERTGKTATAYLLGLALAEKAKAAGVEQIVFDRAGHAYHGRVKAVADGARDGGLMF